jgi:hypothetical protein
VGCYLPRRRWRRAARDCGLRRVPPPKIDRAAVGPQDGTPATAPTPKVAPSLSGKKFDLSSVRDLKKKGPGRPRTAPIDPNWHDLKAIESYIYDTIPAGHDFDKLEELISEVRSARQDGDTDAYATALRDLLQFHYDSFDASNEYKSPLDLVKADRFMSPREVAKVAGFLHNKDRSGTRAKSYDEVRDDLAKDLRTKIPRISSILAALAGDWKAEGALELIDRYQSEFETAYKDAGLSGSEAKFRANSKALAKVRKMMDSPSSAHIKLSSANDNADIFVYMDTDLPAGSPYAPVINDAEAAAILGGIRKARANRFNKDRVIIHAMAGGTDLPKSVAAQIGEDDAAFTYHGGNGGVFIYPKKVTAVGTNLSFNPNWYSTDVSSLEAAYQHIIVHETGHLMMYKHWGSDKDNGRASLVADMKKFKVSGGASEYGDQSPSENFAEQYAKYLLTGDATPEFLALLESKGLTKAQINKKWREAYKTGSHSKFFDFLDKIWEDDAAQFVPEFNGPEASEYIKDGRYGSPIVHKLARLLGFVGNKPTEIDAVPNDKYKIWRAVSPIDRGPQRIEADQLHEEFRTLDVPWYGFGMYGDGQYFSTAESDTYSFGSDAMAFSLDSNAKVYVYGGSRSSSIYDRSKNGEFSVERFSAELENSLLREIVLNEVAPDATEAEIKVEIRLLKHKLGLTGDSQKDASILAGIFGFQGIEIVGANSGNYFVVLDRSMLRMPKVTKNLLRTSRSRYN